LTYAARMNRPLVLVLLAIVLSSAILVGGTVRYLQDNFEES
jgi:hypothetical protein